MSTQEPSAVVIETDLFTFEAPEGYEVESLEERAELAGPNDQFLVVSSYEIDSNSAPSELKDFENNIAEAMREAADESDLVTSKALGQDAADNGLQVWSLKSHATDRSHFFDQYSVVQGTVAIVITIEGSYADRSSSAAVEESVHAIEFK